MKKTPIAICSLLVLSFAAGTGEMPPEPEGPGEEEPKVQYRNWWRLRPFEVEGRWGYRTRRRRLVIIRPRFDGARPFSEGLAVVILGGKRGYIDTTGEVVIRAQFEKAFPFSEGLASVQVRGGWGFNRLRPRYGYIDRSGKFIIKPQFDVGYDFSEGLAAVRIGSRFGYVNREEETVIPLQFDWAEPFSEDRAAVMVGDKWGYVDRTGMMVIEPIYDQALSFVQGRARVREGRKHLYIDKDGRAAPLMTGEEKAISVTHPPDRYLCHPGEFSPICWAAGKEAGSFLAIDLYRSGRFCGIISTCVSSNAGCYWWLIPSYLLPAADYTVRISSLDDPWLCGCSGSFSVVAPAEETGTASGEQEYL